MIASSTKFEISFSQMTQCFVYYQSLFWRLPQWLVKKDRKWITDWGIVNYILITTKHTF